MFWVDSVRVVWEVVSLSKWFFFRYNFHHVILVRDHTLVTDWQ